MYAHLRLGISKLAPRLGWLIAMLLGLSAFGAQAQTAIEAPTLSISGATTNSLTLSWTAVSGATGYEYHRYLPREDHTAQVDGSTTSVTVTGLDPATYYGYVVSTIVNGDKSSKSNHVPAFTQPLAPTNFRTTCVAGTVVELAWNAVGKREASHVGMDYELKIDSGSWQSRDGSTARVIKQLSVNTAYTFYVRAKIYIVGASTGRDDRPGPEASLSVTTAAAAVEPPTDLQTPVAYITQTNIKLTWTASSTSSVSSYEVSSDGSTWIDSGSDLEHTFTNLDPNTSYTLRVRSKSGTAYSCANSALPTKTWPNPPTAPSGLTTSGATQNSITLSWVKPASATAYKARKDSDTWTTLDDVAIHTFRNLSAGTSYNLQIIASNSGGDSSAASVNAWTVPNAPSGLAASGITQSAITLSWSAVTGAASYDVRGGTHSAWHNVGTALTYTFTGLSASSVHPLQVRAVNSGGESAATSTNPNPRTLAPLPTAPAAPTALSTSGITQSAITLGWTKSTGATAYKVRKDSSDSWTTLGDVATHTFGSLNANTQYTLEVVASNSGGDSTAASVSATTLASTPTTLANPTSVTSSGITQTSVVMVWTKASAATSYEVQGGTVNSWTDVGDVATYTFTGLSADTQYTLQVHSKTSQTTSTGVSITRRTLPNAPAAPTSLSTSGITQTAITLNWTKSAGATSYEVNGGALSAWNDVGDVATYEFTGLSANTQYTLQVRAVNTGGESTAASDTASTLALQPGVAPVAPVAPTGLTATGLTTDSITLGWTKPSGATTYKVRKDSSDSWTTLGDVDEYVFTGLNANTQYTMQVVASNLSGDSPTASTSATTLTTLPTSLADPTNVRATDITENSITLKWTKPNGATEYHVRGGALNYWLTLGNVGSYTFTGLTADVSYFLSVRAANVNTQSDRVMIAASTLSGPLAAPTSLSPSAITTSSITLGWTKSSGATSYEVQGGTHNSWHDVGDVASYNFTGLSAGTDYVLKVRAKDSDGESSPAQTTLRTRPAAPTGLTTSDITQTSITLTWTKSPGATAYKLRKNSSDSWMTLGNVNKHIFSNLAANTQYTLEVIASNIASSKGDSAPASISARTLAATQPAAPAAPSGLTTSGITQSAITLGWTKSAGATAYKVRKDSSDSWTTLGDVATHTFSGLSANTQYTLEVVASNNGGDSSAASVSARTLAATQPAAPAAPSGLTTSGITQSAITLGWTKSAGATAYKVRKDSSDSWTTLGDVATHTFSGLSANTQYTLEVVASNNGGDSSAASVSARTLAAQTAALADPTGVTTSGVTQTSIVLVWNKASAATSYEIQGGTVNSWIDVGDVATYTFTGLSADTAYNLKVRSKNSQTTSSGFSLTRSTLPNVPAAPTALTTSGITQTAITLGWTKSAGATSYEVQGGAHNSWHDVGDVASDTFTGLSANTEYTLQVRAVNSGGESAAASTSPNPRTLPNAPAAPTGLSTSDITDSAITLGWTKSAGATAYKARKDSDSWTTLGDVNSYRFTGLSGATSYDFEVIASNSGGDSTAATLSASTINAAPPPAAPASPTGLVTSGITQNSITLSWVKSNGATAYKVRKGSDNWTTLGDVALYTFSNLSADTQYNLQVIASSSNGDSTAASINARTLPNALANPTGVTTSGVTQTRIVLVWNKASAATSYEIQGGTVNSWTDVGDVATYTFTGLSADTAYNLKVRSKNSQTTSSGFLLTRSTLPNVPAAPTALTTSGITRSEITLSWAKSAGATSYEVQGGAHNSWHDVGDVASYTFTGLSGDTAYNLQVRAVNNGGVSAAASTSPNNPRTQPGTGQTASDTGSSSDDQDTDPPPSGHGDGDGNDNGNDNNGNDNTGSSNDDQPDLEAPIPKLPAINCSDAQKALIEISTLPLGLNVQCLGPDGIFQSDLVARGIVMGVDVWGWVRGNVEVCFKQAGDLAFLDAAFAPRQQTHVLVYLFDGMTCAQLNRAGTVVLLRTTASTPQSAPARATTEATEATEQSAVTASVSSDSSVTFSNCMVRTSDYINFRATPGGTLIHTLSPQITLTAYEKRGDWFQVDFYGQRGWLHADYVQAIGDCG